MKILFLSFVLSFLFGFSTLSLAQENQENLKNMRIVLQDSEVRSYLWCSVAARTILNDVPASESYTEKALNRLIKILNDPKPGRALLDGYYYFSGYMEASSVHLEKSEISKVYASQCK